MPLASHSHRITNNKVRSVCGYPIAKSNILQQTIEKDESLTHKHKILKKPVRNLVFPSEGHFIYTTMCTQETSVFF